MLLKAILLTKVLELSAATDTLSLGRTCRSMPLSCAWITAGLEVRCHHLDIDDSFSGVSSRISQVREGVQRLSDSLCAAVERLANDLYESECHFLYEIVQLPALHKRLERSRRLYNVVCY